MNKVKPQNNNQGWRTTLQEDIKKRIVLLQKTIEEKKKENNGYPNGKLRVIKHSNSYQYFCRLDSKDTSGKYIPANQRNKACELAQKEYNIKLIKKASEELYYWEKIIKSVEKINAEKIYDEFYEGKRHLITPIILPDDLFIKQWEAVEYEKNPYPFGNSTYFTQKNEQVRSKSEIIIANLLHKNGVPYRYEYPIEIDGKVKFADFYVVNVRTRQEFVFEHLGMMDDRGYAQDNVDKINRYIANGYFPGINLIYSMETSKNTIDIRIIEDIIKQYFV